MKSFEECLDIIEEQPHAHHVTLNEYVDADLANGIIRGICSSYALGDEKSMIVFAKSLALQVTTQMIVLAEEMSKKSVNPLDIHFDEVDAGLDRLTIRQIGGAE